MVKVKVKIPNFRDKNNKHLGLLQPGYEYEVTRERAKELVDKGIVEIVKSVKSSKEE